MMEGINRRTALKTGLAVAAGWIVAPRVAAAPRAAAGGAPPPAGAYTLPPLGYAYDALEPYIDARTMEIHHDRHHAGYVRKLNAALEGHAELASAGIEKLLARLDSLPADIRESVRNNGGGHANHSLFWKCLKKEGGRPSRELHKALADAFGSLEGFESRLKKTAATRFGSGWGWLVMDRGGKLSVMSTANQDSPVSRGLVPLLGVDVWEHAYYLKYQNRRGDYLDAFARVIHWDFVNGRYARMIRGL